MSINYEAYETVVGLEVHAQLLTQSKLFCGDSTAFGSEPNTQVSAITLAHPGTLPKMNKKAIEYAVKMGLACNAEIVMRNYFARKNYFYPDLPKGYQLSQHTTPICKGGFVPIKVKDSEKKIRLNRIHLEEDAGKSLHDADAGNTVIDFNRAGVPLIEIVSEPDIQNGDEAHTYLSELRKLVRYLEICDGNMEQGSFRCDANISVRKKGVTTLGTKVEVKNMNSMRFVKQAIEWEAKRMIGLLEEGLPVTQETRSFDAACGTSFSIRAKEDADDYRYFADPDLTPFFLTSEYIDSVRKAIPPLPNERKEKYISQYELSNYDAALLAEEKEFSDYFDGILANFRGNEQAHAKAAANWMLGPIKSWLNNSRATMTQFPLQPHKISTIIEMIENGKMSFSQASSRLFNELLKNPEAHPADLAAEKNLLQNRKTDHIEYLVDEVLGKFPDKVLEYKKGKKGLMGLFVGEVLKLSKGQADPKVTNELLLQKLKS